MRKRFKKGDIRKIHGSWIGRYYDEYGKRQTVKLGRMSEMTKSEAWKTLAEILRPINVQARCVNTLQTFQQFVEHVFLPSNKRGGGKRSTAMTTEDRIRRYLVAEFGTRPLAEITDEELQAFLNQMASKLSFSTVDHLRWDLLMIFRTAVSKRYINWNPAPPKLLYTPRECRMPQARVMSEKEVSQLFEVIEGFELKERLMIKFALVGLRPGEFLALQRGDVDTTAKRLNICRRIYRGDIDTPKTKKSIRLAGISSGLLADLKAWLKTSPDTGANGWLFPSENLKTPAWKDTVWQDHIRPKLESKGLGWLNFQILRRTAVSTARRRNLDPKAMSDQFGHGVDVHLNVYAQTPLEQKIEVVEDLEATLAN